MWQKTPYTLIIDCPLIKSEVFAVPELVEEVICNWLSSGGAKTLLKCPADDYFVDQNISLRRTALAGSDLQGVPLIVEQCPADLLLFLSVTLRTEADGIQKCLPKMIFLIE